MAAAVQVPCSILLAAAPASREQRRLENLNERESGFLTVPVLCAPLLQASLVYSSIQKIAAIAYFSDVARPFLVV